MAMICGDNRLEIIGKAKEALIESTNIEDSPEEMAVLNNFLFRCWQMGWLDKYDKNKADKQPTVFDMERVVEQLEAHAIEFEAFGICSDYVELSHAIEIVKGGAE